MKTCETCINRKGYSVLVTNDVLNFCSVHEKFVEGKEVESARKCEDWEVEK